jgi:alkylation response protein AidB-like acyl-CoA dehydrogenase
MTHARPLAAGSAAPGQTLSVTGTKRFVRPGPGADGWIVAADLASETALVWVDALASGLQVEHESGVDGMGTATLRMDEA